MHRMKIQIMKKFLVSQSFLKLHALLLIIPFRQFILSFSFASMKLKSFPEPIYRIMGGMLTNWQLFPFVKYNRDPISLLLFSLL